MTDRKRRLARGIAWTAVSQVFEAIASFAAMLVLVRLIPPGEYGRAASATGVLTFLNLGSARAFIDYALQLPEGEEPDWTRLWTIACYLQVSLFVLTHAVAFALSATASLAPIAPLLHIAAFGMLLEGPAYIGATMTRRALDIARLRALLLLAVLLKLVGTVALASVGFGAVAIVSGGTVLTAVPMAVDLLLVRGWRPGAGWWRLVNISGSADILRFGTQRIASALLGGGRSLIEGLVLPLTIGYEAVGLLGRAQALFSVTVGRVTAALTDTAYPFVARASGDPPRLARWSGGLVLGLLIIAVPGAIFLMLHGTLVTTVIFGAQWLPLTPYIVPAVSAALGATFAVTAATVLLAAGRLRDALTMDVVCIVAAIAAALVTLVSPSVGVYAWSLGVASLVTGIAALGWLARRSPTDPAILDMVAPALAAGVAGGTASVGMAGALATAPPKVRLVAIAIAFGIAAAAALLVGFRRRVYLLEELVRSLKPVRAEEDAVVVTVTHTPAVVVDASLDGGALAAPEPTSAKSL